MRQFADSLFTHQSYLKIGGRPVVILYLTRTLEGGYAKAIEKCRAELKSRGWNVFLIADEIFWSVVPADKAPEDGALSTDEPQQARIRLFDAITAYNLYDFSRTRHAGYGAQSDFIRDAAALFQRYRNAAGPNAALVPSVIPGYNDRGVRVRRDHYAIPRQWSSNAPDSSFLGEAIERLAIPFIEALACGTGLILSDIPVYREIADGRAVFVEAGDVEAWRQAMVAPVPAQPAWREETLRRFTCEETARMHVQAYESVVG